MAALLRSWLGTKQFTRHYLRTSIDQVPWCHMVSLGHYELKHNIKKCRIWIRLWNQRKHPTAHVILTGENRPIFRNLHCVGPPRDLLERLFGDQEFYNFTLDILFSHNACSVVNALAPGRCNSNFENTIFKLIIQDSSLGTRCEIAIRGMPQNMRMRSQQWFR